MATVFYGSDTSCTTDVPLVSVQVTDPKTLIGQRIIRRLTTPRGGLAVIGGDPNFGWDVRQYILKRVSPTSLGQAEQQVSAECVKDEQVQSASATLTYSAGKLTITVQILASIGPFELTLVLTPDLDITAFIDDKLVSF